MARCFVGYLLPEENKSEIVKLQSEIEKWPLKCKMVERENLHINFSFLGEVKESEIERIKEEIEKISKEFKKMEVEMNGLVAIPNESYIRVLALKVVGDENLSRLFDEVVKRIGGDSKPPHITLCRVKAIDNKKEVRENVEREKHKTHGKFIINSIQLIKSELKPSGPIYTILHSSELV
ncbi:MAG: RNA 2',3'-cyclic phosphodiesterase [Candidatus Aenigmatarchaeota archaeon]